MVAAGNPRSNIAGLKDVAAPTLRASRCRTSKPSVAKQIQDSLRKAGGDELVRTVYEDKAHGGTTFLTQVHHRQTPMRILAGQSDAGVVWTS